jgi:hypothetical protein
VERLFDHVDLQAALAGQRDGVEDGLLLRRQVPQVGSRYNTGGSFPLAELLAKPVGLIEVHLVTGGLGRTQPGDQLRYFPGRAENDRKRRPDLLLQDVDNPARLHDSIPPLPAGCRRPDPAVHPQGSASRQ